MATQLPISSRKILITSCQTQSFDKSDYENFFFPALKDFHTGTFLSRDDFYASVADIVPSPVMSSIFWMVLRTTLEPREYDESATVSLQGFQKELGAAQTLFCDYQVISYSAFFRVT
jgi:hypothetical protein